MSDKILVEQNKVIIALLARSTVGLSYIENIVRGNKKKGNPENFVRAYNALDGTKNVSEIAKMVGVGVSAMSELLRGWEEKGIIYRVGSGKEVVYWGVLKIPQKSAQDTRGRAGKRKKKELKTKTHGGIAEVISNTESSNVEGEYNGVDQSEPSRGPAEQIESIGATSLSPDSAES